ncbi:RluA family pseudouridine synthase [Miniphocaeibacter halophilus]|uniref:RluA family pseudouridine synthase n=1 Tax=Miniphocaeibacter halophilus TaxID=2931922 RepID=A0AC61MPM2_9FIRM|nr:RluA family pseudouridine synthase [Miniphocaeibacter halophilus]QQK07491.1 RluA family pseudouridine synthase [Miniphocaeibacter halophilus]
MREIKIDENDSKQRLDRFMVKYLPKASKSLINKYIRTKKIKLNKKRANPNDILQEGDLIQIYIYEETLSKYEDKKIYTNLDYNLNIIYEDDNIAIINKPSGTLSHAAGKEDYGNNIVDNFIAYLIKTKKYNPRKEKSFVPALSNRLDRNTSGLLIGCKNKETLLQMNNLIKSRKINRNYLTICKGKIEDGLIDSNIKKISDNRMEISKDRGKESKTEVKLVTTNGAYSLVKIKLITGRTHQIRVHLQSINHPIVGDKKYGDKITNKFFSDNFKLENQLLHSYKIEFNGLEGKLSYLNGKEFLAEPPVKFKKIIKKIFGEEYENICR